MCSDWRDGHNDKSQRVSIGRHQRYCCVCSHPEREEIEGEFVAWRSPAAIAIDYGIADRAIVYRHAHALGLFTKRQRNIRAALERIIERAGDVDVTASAVVQRFRHTALIFTRLARRNSRRSFEPA
jgi:hypothetical protein